MTFNPDWHTEGGWIHSTQTHSFIIQSVPELSTWINKSPSYLTTQNWISAPTGSGWRKLSAPLFWFAYASYRGRILFFSPIHPHGFQSLESCFPPCAWDVCVPPHHPYMILFPAYLRLWAYIFQQLINPRRCRNVQVRKKENRIFHVVSL